jgi:hypothetical protein
VVSTVSALFLLSSDGSLTVHNTGALYFSEMALDGGLSTEPANAAGAKVHAFVRLSDTRPLTLLSRIVRYRLLRLAVPARPQGSIGFSTHLSVGTDAAPAVHRRPGEQRRLERHDGQLGQGHLRLLLLRDGHLGGQPVRVGVHPPPVLRAFLPRECMDFHSHGDLQTVGLEACTGSQCNAGGLCDPAGCDFNSWRMGNQTFLGPGLTIDTTKKITVVTQFIADSNGDLSEIRRKYVQVRCNASPAVQCIKGLAGRCCLRQQLRGNFRRYAVQLAHGRDLRGAEDNLFAQEGGMKAMGAAFKRGMVLVLSIWDDTAVNMLWLDSDYPATASATAPGVNRGPCSPSSGVPATIEVSQASNQVVYSNIKWGDIDSTYPATGSTCESLFLYLTESQLIRGFSHAPGLVAGLDAAAHDRAALDLAGLFVPDADAHRHRAALRPVRWHRLDRRDRLRLAVHLQGGLAAVLLPVPVGRRGSSVFFCQRFLVLPSASHWSRLSLSLHNAGKTVVLSGPSLSWWHSFCIRTSMQPFPSCTLPLLRGIAHRQPSCRRVTYLRHSNSYLRSALGARRLSWGWLELSWTG